MRFRPKKKSPIGEDEKKKKKTPNSTDSKRRGGNKAAVVSIPLFHGDIVMMHGTELQKHYEVCMRTPSTRIDRLIVALARGEAQGKASLRHDVSIYQDVRVLERRSNKRDHGEEQAARRHREDGLWRRQY
jgi:hypothetical protein